MIWWFPGYHRPKHRQPGNSLAADTYISASMGRAGYISSDGGDKDLKQEPGIRPLPFHRMGITNRPDCSPPALGYRFRGDCRWDLRKDCIIARLLVQRPSTFRTTVRIASEANRSTSTWLSAKKAIRHSSAACRGDLSGQHTLAHHWFLPLRTAPNLRSWPMREAQAPVKVHHKTTWPR